MTVHTWQREIYNVCKFCKHLTDRKISRNRYFCDKNQCHIYHVQVNRCSKTKALRIQAKEVSEKALDEAFRALTKRGNND